MANATRSLEIDPPTVTDVFTEVVRQGARDLLAKAIEAEVAAYTEAHAHLVDPNGHRLIVRNGYMPQREILTGIGPVEVKQPRIHDRRTDEEKKGVAFTSSILPRYMRRTQSLEVMIPWLYLKGISTGDFTEVLEKLLGRKVTGVGPNTVVRLKQVWEADFQAWSRRSLTGKRYVYLWVDGIHFNIRLEEDRQCILVVMGATGDGRKELVAVQDGYRESEQSWLELLLDLKNRGLVVDPDLAIGDGGLGFWKALPQVYATTRTQRCWVHKTGNVLNNLPRREQPKAKAKLHEIWMASSRDAAEKSFDHFIETYQAKYPKAVTCLEKDRTELLTFFDFPAEHWRHIRTTNPCESTFATVRLRTTRTKGSGSRLACLTMVFKLAQAAEKGWRTLNGAHLLKDVIHGVRFKDGIKDNAA
jgi:putative transposase